jgi:iron complex outermembrane receptor protein
MVIDKNVCVPRVTMSACVGLLLATQMAHAQEQAAANAGEVGAVAIDEVVVTAQRRQERLQDVPITISSITADMMRQANVQGLSDIAKVTAGVRFDSRITFIQPTIRGIGTSIILAGGGSNIGLYQDGFYSPALQASDFQLMNIDSIQVVKGPQGTLFGRNTMGGGILVNTTKPSTNSRAVFEAAYGSYNMQRYQAYATTGLTDRIAVDFAGMLTKGDGWAKNIYNGDDKVAEYENSSLRFGVNFDVTDDLSFLFRYARTDKDDPTGFMQTPYVLDGAPACTACLLPGAVYSTKRGKISADELLEYRFKSDAYQLTGTWDMGPATLTSYTQYRKDRTPRNYYSLDYTNLPSLALNLLDRNTTFTQELLLTSAPGTRLQWTAGLFYFDWRSEFPFVGTSMGVANPQPENYSFSSRSGADSKSIAAYADVTYELTDRLFLTGGVRYTEDDVENAYYQFGTAAAVHLPTLSTSRTTPRAVIRYSLNDASNIYVSAKGYKAAIYNVGGASSVPIKPESLWAYEIGYKFANPGLSFNVSGYYYDYTNEQLAASRVINGIPQNLITNAANSELYGIDLDLRYRVTDALELNLGANWSHARYDNFPEAPRFTVTPTNLYPQSSIDASGFRMTRAPDFSANVGASYTMDVAGGEIVLSGNFYYTSKYYYDYAEQIPQDSYNTLDLRAEWTDPSDRYTLAIAGKNVTDEVYTVQGGQNVFGIGAVYGAPRTVEGSIRVKF